MKIVYAAANIIITVALMILVVGILVPQDEVARIMAWFIPLSLVTVTVGHWLAHRVR